MALTADMKELLPVFVLVAVGVTGLLLLRSSRYFSRQRERSSSLTSTRRTPHRRDPSLHDAPSEPARWEVLMHEKARDLTGQLDSKMSALGALIAEAERATAQLERALAAAYGQPETTTPGLPGDQAESLRPAPPAETADPAFVEQSASPAPPNAIQRRKAEVYTLADYGFDAREIAHRTQMPIGEVDLMLRLRDSR
jgi:hypothetical protein